MSNAKCLGSEFRGGRNLFFMTTVYENAPNVIQGWKYYRLLKWKWSRPLRRADKKYERFLQDARERYVRDSRETA